MGTRVTLGKRERLVIAAVCAAGVLTPSAAHAGTLSSEPFQTNFEGGIVTGTRIVYTGAPGEANAFTLALADGTATLADSGAPVVVATPACQQADAHTARCPGMQVDLTEIAVRLGDGNDTASLAGLSTEPSGKLIVRVTVDGGPGDDQLQSTVDRAELAGGDGADRLLGSPVNDALDGGGGNDVLLGREGDDELRGGAGDDTIDGGPGEDLAEWDDHTGAVAVDLAAGTGAATDDHDTLASIEDAVGGRGNDRISGDGGANRLSGGPGDDQLSGGAGADALFGGGGRNRLDGGAGNDTLERFAGVLACGAGTDRIAPSGSDGLIGRDCEQVGLVPAGAGARVAVLDDGFASARLRRHGNAVRIGLRLPSRTNGKLYHVHATVRSGGRTIGRATLRTRAGRGRLQQRTIVVHVNRRGAFHANVTIASSLFSIHFRAPVNGG